MLILLALLGSARSVALPAADVVAVRHARGPLSGLAGLFAGQAPGLPRLVLETSSRILVVIAR